MTKDSKTYPVIDLFAGPGGLGEGFATLRNKNGKAVFESVASIEMDKTAHDTLTLRHFFRCFREDQVPDAYYRYVSGEISKLDLIELYPKQWNIARKSSLNITLGSKNHELVKKAIEKRLAKSKNWILVGGPPCQAYSLVGRSRMMGMVGFEEDERHFLYREYLKIIVDHRPPVFVMENVKGLLSSKINGEFVVQKIVDDLSQPYKSSYVKAEWTTIQVFTRSALPDFLRTKLILRNSLSGLRLMAYPKHDTGCSLLASGKILISAHPVFLLPIRRM